MKRFLCESVLLDKQQPPLPHPFIALYCSIEESSLTYPVFSVDVRSVFQQQFDNRCLPIPTGKMKRRQRKLKKRGQKNVAIYEIFVSLLRYFSVKGRRPIAIFTHILGAGGLKLTLIKVTCK